MNTLNPATEAKWQHLNAAANLLSEKYGDLPALDCWLAAMTDATDADLMGTWLGKICRLYRLNPTEGHHGHH